MSNSIAIITFLQKDEVLPKNFEKLLIRISSYYTVQGIIFSEANNNNKSHLFKYVNMKKSTKFEKIKWFLSEINCEYFICIDSDLTLIVDEIECLISNSILNKSDIAWGKIQTNNYETYTSRLVAVDKILSHYILRPFLWYLNIGISIPGQLFLLKKSSFEKLFDFNDTYLEDLVIGMFARCSNNIKITMFKDILANEEPSFSLLELMKQRKRWAQGYRKIIKGNYKNHKYFKYILIHGFCYHLIPIIHLLLLLFMLYKYSLMGLIYLIFLSVLLSNRKSKLIITALTYIFIFPILHIYWFKSLLISKE